MFIGEFYNQLSDNIFTGVSYATWMGLRLSLKTCGILTLLSCLLATISYVICNKWRRKK